MNNGWFIDSSGCEPLKKEELEKYFKKAKAGDMKAREKIIVHNIRLVIYQVNKKFLYNNYDKKDLVSIGLVGLIKAVDSFDITKNIQFATYAAKCINNEIMMYMIKNQKFNNDFSFEQPFSEYDEKEDMYFDRFLSDETINIEEDYERKENILMIRNLIEELSNKDKEIVMLYFGFYGDRMYSQLEIAEKIGVTQPHVSRLLSKIKKLIRQKLEMKELLFNNSVKNTDSKDTPLCLKLQKTY